MLFTQSRDGRYDLLLLLLVIHIARIRQPHAIALLNKTRSLTSSTGSYILSQRLRCDLFVGVNSVSEGEDAGY